MRVKSIFEIFFIISNGIIYLLLVFLVKIQ